MYKSMEWMMLKNFLLPQMKSAITFCQSIELYEHLTNFHFWNVNAVLTYISDPFGKLPTYRPANIIPRHLPLKIIKSHFV